MSNLIENKEQFKAALRTMMAKQIAEVIFREVPNAAFVYFNANVEYSDEDYEYYNAILSIYDEDNNYILDLDETDWNDEETYKKVVGLAQSIQDVVDSQDFVFAYGFESSKVDIRPYK